MSDAVAEAATTSAVGSKSTTSGSSPGDPTAKAPAVVPATAKGFLGRLWANPEYADIIIRFSGRERKCHKVVLCRKSKYFRGLCGKDADFKVRRSRHTSSRHTDLVYQEKDATAIELKDDDPDALEAVLRCFYNGSYQEYPGARPKDWAYHLEVSLTADKYLLPDLSEAAFDTFEDILLDITDVEELHKVIQAVRCKDVTDRIKEVVKNEEKRNLLGLMKIPKYRETVESGKDGTWDLLCELANDTAGREEMNMKWCVCGYTQVYIKSVEHGSDLCRCGERLTFSTCLVPLTGWVKMAQRPVK